MMIPTKAVLAAKKALEAVTPPPGVSKADWLAGYGSFALYAGAIAAAAPYLHAAGLESAANAIDEDQYDDLDPYYADWLRDRARKIREEAE